MTRIRADIGDRFSPSLVRIEATPQKISCHVWCLRLWGLADGMTVTMNQPRRPLDNITIPHSDQFQDLTKGLSLILLHLDNSCRPMLQVLDPRGDWYLTIDGSGDVPEFPDGPIGGAGCEYSGNPLFSSSMRTTRADRVVVVVVGPPDPIATDDPGGCPSCPFPLSSGIDGYSLFASSRVITGLARSTSSSPIREHQPMRLVDELQEHWFGGLEHWEHSDFLHLSAMPS